MVITIIVWYDFRFWSIKKWDDGHRYNYFNKPYKEWTLKDYCIPEGPSHFYFLISSLDIILGNLLSIILYCFKVESTLLLFRWFNCTRGSSASIAICMDQVNEMSYHTSQETISGEKKPLGRYNNYRKKMTLEYYPRVIEVTLPFQSMSVIRLYKL